MSSVATILGSTDIDDFITAESSLEQLANLSSETSLKHLEVELEDSLIEEGMNDTGHRNSPSQLQ